MRTIKWKPSVKQKVAFDILLDKETTEVLYGGGAGGGKSYLACVWAIYMSLRYAGVRGLMGRAVLKSLKESTLLTFFEICKTWGLKKDLDYKYNSMEGHIKFSNGSEIYLKDLANYPSDPEFDRLGSTEYSYAFIDEASQVSEKAKNIVMSRIRYKLDEFSLVPKILIASNPAKNFMYYQFYKPHTKGTLPDYRKFVSSLVTDNPFISEHYIENLNKLDLISKERLLHGNWEYDNDPAKLMDYDSIVDIFTNDFVATGEKYITSDLAMQGRDLFIITSWDGLRCKVELTKQKSGGKEIEEDLRRIANKLKVPRSHIVPDSGGLGSYLESYMEGIKPFNGAKSAYNKEYTNLRSECYFKLAEMINKKELYVDCEDPNIKEQIIEELEQVKRDAVDKDDQKKKIISKDKIKENLGRSPDFADCLMMRMMPLVGLGKVGIITDNSDIFG